MIADYRVANRLNWSCHGCSWTLQMVKKVQRSYVWAVRLLTQLYNFFLNRDDNIWQVCWTRKSRKKISLAPVSKYGTKVSLTLKGVHELDSVNNNTYWHDMMELEISAMILLGCFEFVDPAIKIAMFI